MRTATLILSIALPFMAAATDREELDKFIDNGQYIEALQGARKLYQKDKKKDKNISFLIRCINYRISEIFDNQEDNLKAYELLNETLHLSLERNVDLDELRHTLYDYNSVKYSNPSTPQETFLRSTFLSFYENLIWKKKVKNIKDLLQEKASYKKAMSSLKEEFSRTIHWECSEKNWSLILKDFMVLWREAFEADREKCLEFMLSRDFESRYEWEFVFPDAVYLKSPNTNSNKDNILRSKNELTTFFSTWRKSKDPAIQLLGEVYCLHLKVFDDNNDWQKQLRAIESKTYQQLQSLKSKRVKRLYISILVSLNFFRSKNEFNQDRLKDAEKIENFKKTVAKIRNLGIFEDETVRAYIHSNYSAGDPFGDGDSDTKGPSVNQITKFLNEQKNLINSPSKFEVLLTKAELKKLEKYIDKKIKYINPPDLPNIKFSKVEKLYTNKEKTIIDMLIKKDQLYFIDNTHFYQLDLSNNKCKELLKVAAYFFDVNEKFSVFSQGESAEIYTSKYKKVITLDKFRLVNGYVDGISLYKNRLFINTCSNSHSGRRILWDYNIENDQLKRIADSADTAGKTPLDNISGYSTNTGATDVINERVLFTAYSKDIRGLFEYSFKTGGIKLLKSLQSYAGKIIEQDDSSFLFNMESKTFSLTQDGKIETLIARSDGGSERQGSIFGKLGNSSSSSKSIALIGDSLYHISDLDGYSGDYLIRAYPGGTKYEIIEYLQKTKVDWHQAQLKRWNKQLIVVAPESIWKLKPESPTHPLTIADETLEILAPTRSYSDKPTKLSIHVKEDFDEIEWTYSHKGKIHTFNETLTKGQRSLSVEVPIIDDSYLQGFTINATALKDDKAVAWGRSKLCDTYPAYEFKWFKEAQGPRKFCFIDFAEPDSLSSLIQKASPINVISEPQKLSSAQIMPAAISGRFLEKYPEETMEFIRKVTAQQLPIVIHGPCSANPYLPVSFKGNQKLSGNFFNKIEGHRFEFWPFQNWEGPTPLTHQGAGDEKIKWQSLLQSETLPMVTESLIGRAKIYSVFPDLAKSFKKEIYSGYLSYRILSLLSDKKADEEKE